MCLFTLRFDLPLDTLQRLLWPVDPHLFLRNFSDSTKRHPYGVEKNENFRGDREPFSEYLLSVDLNGIYPEVAKTLRIRPADADIKHAHVT